jgi:hypothetical protein
MAGHASRSGCGRASDRGRERKPAKIQGFPANLCFGRAIPGFGRAFQSFRLTSPAFGRSRQGFRRSRQGFRRSRQGFRRSRQGFRLASPDARRVRPDSSFVRPPAGGGRRCARRAGHVGGWKFYQSGAASSSALSTVCIGFVPGLTNFCRQPFAALRRLGFSNACRWR